MKGEKKCPACRKRVGRTEGGLVLVAAGKVRHYHEHCSDSARQAAFLARPAPVKLVKRPAKAEAN